MEMLPLAVYALLKFVAYAAWCALGARLARLPAPDAWRRALLLGLLRLAIGIAVGAVVATIGITLARAPESVPLGIAVLAPIRWLEWSVLALVVTRTRPRPIALILGVSARMRAWQAGGILVSFATDLLLVMAMGTMRAMIC